MLMYKGMIWGEGVDGQSVVGPGEGTEKDPFEDLNDYVAWTIKVPCNLQVNSILTCNQYLYLSTHISKIKLPHLFHPVLLHLI